ncbi:MAG: 4'-phosphopantetheinyl transferase superfamily protein [Alphaproteobacteria bacterium]|nr:4'-phosphopantetheinyl transferase superfamily protein [Alphaproteobacteria bacterium]
MAQHHSIEWLSPHDLPALAPAPAGSAWTRVLLCDLRDTAVLPLLKPPPLPGDYADERRPGASDREYFLARRAALRSFVALCVDGIAQAVVIGYDEPGAPRVRAPAGLFVSVSGRGAIAALAVSTHRTGVDFEPLTEEAGIIPDVLHLREREALAAMNAQASHVAFLRIWTAKESWLKAKGQGLNQDPATLCAPWKGTAIASMIDEAVAIQPLAGEWRETAFAGVDVIAACVTLA